MAPYTPFEYISQHLQVVVFANKGASDDGSSEVK
jgi:hypothetical protein